MGGAATPGRPLENDPRRRLCRSLGRTAIQRVRQLSPLRAALPLRRAAGRCGNAGGISHPHLRARRYRDGPRHLRTGRAADRFRRGKRPALLLLRRGNSRPRGRDPRRRFAASYGPGHALPFRPRLPCLLEHRWAGRSLPRAGRVDLTEWSCPRHLGLRAAGPLSPFRGGAPDRLHRVPLGVPARAVGGTRQRQVRTAPLPADRVLPDAMDGVSRARQPGAAHSRDVRPTRPRRPSRRSGQSPLLGPIADGFRVPLLLRPVLGSRRTTQRHQHSVSLLRPRLRHGGQCR